MQTQTAPSANPAAAIPLAEAAASLLNFSFAIQNAANVATPEAGVPRQVMPLGSKGLREAFQLLRRDAPERMLDQFRQMRSRLFRTREEWFLRKTPLSCLSITSLRDGEGKSYVARNLALMMAVVPECRVLVVDANVRRPSYDALMEVPSAPGLREVVGGHDWRTAARKMKEMELYVLSLGNLRPSPMEPIDYGNLKRWLESARSDFDWILLDGPAMNSGPDAEVLASVADASLIVLPPAKCTFDEFAQLRALIGPDRIAGVVFNG